jgi:hypothetical protein
VKAVNIKSTGIIKLSLFNFVQAIMAHFIGATENHKKRNKGLDWPSK